MAGMNPKATEVLERFRAAEKLDGAARERMSQTLLHKLARGEAALPGIDAHPVVLPKASWFASWLASAGGKAGLALLALVSAAAVMQLVTTHDQPAAISTPATKPLPPSAASVRVQPETRPVLTDHGVAERATTSAGPSAPAPNLIDTTARAERRKAAHVTAPPKGFAEPTPARASVSDDAPSEPAPAPNAGEARRQEPAVLRDAQEKAAEPARTAPAPRPASTLDAELGLLHRAYSQLNAGKPEQAFALLDEHEARFPHGELEQAREVARMLALCAMGRERAAKLRAQDFLSAFPKSPFVGRVRGICPAAKKLSP